VANRSFKFFAALINAKRASGFYKPFALRFLRLFCASRFLISASFGLLIHSPISVINCPIGQALPDDTLKCIIRASKIVDAQRNAVVIAEVKLG
jgi:hypothetical protein